LRNIYLLTLVVVVTNVLGNAALGWGIKTEAWVWAGGGVALLAAWTLLRMQLLRFADLTWVLPVTSVGYVLTALLGRFVFAEQISPQRWAGTLLIVAGSALVARTEAR
jgi:uncharacterized membrane protein